MSHETYHTRARKKYFSTRVSIASTSANYDVDSNLALFKSENRPSTKFSATRGFDEGLRYNIRILPESHPIILRYNATTNDPIYLAADVVFEDFNIQATNIFLSTADQTTAQQDQYIAVAESSGNYTGKYFKLYAVNSTSYAITTYGIWFTLASVGTQPTDTEVTTWVPVDLSAAETNANVAAAIKTALDAISGTPFSTTRSTATLTITHAVSGSAPDITNGGSPGTPSVAVQGAGAATTVQILVR